MDIKIGLHFAEAITLMLHGCFFSNSQCIMLYSFIACNVANYSDILRARKDRHILRRAVFSATVLHGCRRY